MAAGTTIVFIEGVGAGRRELADLVDVVVWVQSDYDEAERRGILRDGGDSAAASFWDEWISAERPFLTEQRPWERAQVILSGTSDAPHDPQRDLVVAHQIEWRSA